MKVRVMLLLLALASLVTLVGAPASAASVPARSLGISPLRSELTIAPGTSFDGALSLTNSGKDPVIVSFNTEVFSVTDTLYDYAFDPAGTGADWVTFSANSITIQPSNSATISYKVAVPISAEPGGRYLSLFASSSPIISGTGVSSINRIASLLYITVAGDVTRTGKVLTFDSPLLAFGDTTWSTTIQNSGSTHFHSIYTVTVKPFFGSTLAPTEADSLILPSSVRFISQSLPHLDWIGLYRLDYTIGLGDTPAKQETRWLLNLPPLQTLALVAIIAAFIVIRLRTKKKSVPKTEQKD